MHLTGIPTSESSYPKRKTFVPFINNIRLNYRRLYENKDRQIACIQLGIMAQREISHLARVLNHDKQYDFYHMQGFLGISVVLREWGAAESYAELSKNHSNPKEPMLGLTDQSLDSIPGGEGL